MAPLTTMGIVSLDGYVADAEGRFDWAVPDEKWGEMVMALVVTSPGSGLTEADLIAYTRTKLAGFKCPKSVEFRDALARTATGKLQKFKLREPYWAGKARQVN